MKSTPLFYAGSPSAWHKVAPWILRCSLAAVWLTSAGTKLLSLDQAKDMVKTILPAFSSSNLATTVAVLIILLEVFLGVSLLVPKALRLAIILNTVLTSAFAGVNLMRISEGVHAPCGCFGKIFTFSPTGTLAIDTILFTIGLALARSNSKSGS